LNIKHVLQAVPVLILLAGCSMPVFSMGVEDGGVVQGETTVSPPGDAAVVEVTPDPSTSRPQSGGGGGGQGEEHLDGFCCGFPDGGNGPFETIVTTIESVDVAASTVTVADPSTVGSVGLVDAGTALRIADITPNGADATLDDLQPGMAVQAEFLVESGDPPSLQALWVLPAEPTEPVTDRPVELRDAPIRAVDTVTNRFVQEPLGEIILYDENTVFILDDESVNGTVAGPEILEIGRWAHVTLLQGPDGPVMEYPPEEPLTAVQIIVHP
jgi:hypothetical protein